MNPASPALATLTGRHSEVWCADFEFTAADGGQPDPVCMVARELHSRREIRLWREELRRLPRAPFNTGPDAVFVAFFASAELSCFLALGWELPARIVDLFAEHRVETNRLQQLTASARAGDLVSDQPRGAPAYANAQGARDVVELTVPHFPLRDSLLADSLLGVREFGTDNQLAGVQTAVNGKLLDLDQKLDVTLEFLRLGAIKGRVITAVDRDTGAPLRSIDLFAAFGTVQPAAVDFAMGGAAGRTPDAGWAELIADACRTVIRTTGRELGGPPGGALRLSDLYGASTPGLVQSGSQFCCASIITRLSKSMVSCFA